MSLKNKIESVELQGKITSITARGNDAIVTLSDTEVWEKILTFKDLDIIKSEKKQDFILGYAHGHNFTVLLDRDKHRAKPVYGISVNKNVTNEESAQYEYLGIAYACKVYCIAARQSSIWIARDGVTEDVNGDPNDAVKYLAELPIPELPTMNYLKEMSRVLIADNYDWMPVAIKPLGDKSYDRRQLVGLSKDMEKEGSCILNVKNGRAELLTNFDKKLFGLDVNRDESLLYVTLANKNFIARIDEDERPASNAELRILDSDSETIASIALPELVGPLAIRTDGKIYAAMGEKQNKLALIDPEAPFE